MAEMLRTAGRVESGPGAVYVHLTFLLGNTKWATVCAADSADGNVGGRHVRPVLELVDCPDCMAARRVTVRLVNRKVAERQQREAEARELVAEFLRWAAEQYDEGGAVLAVYAGGTRLYPMRDDERERAVDLWLESSRGVG